VVHVANLTGYRSGEGSGGFRYYNNFTAIPISLPFRPLRKTPRPVVQGTQTAVVVGSGGGEEIFTDKYRRAKVQFHWDRQGKQNLDDEQGTYKNNSGWVRVGTPIAGKRWGMIHLPRVGHEVIVGFQEGDPDQPIILGSVYNAEQMPPWTLPDNAPVCGMKSKTVNGTGSNEMSFDDTAGKEKVVFHAQKDMSTTVEDNHEIIVKEGKESLDVKKGDREVKIEMGSDSLTISMGDQKTKIEMGKAQTEAMQSI
jgi:type VI secretion system secreted protein VgrG